MAKIFYPFKNEEPEDKKITQKQDCPVKNLTTDNAEK